MLLGGDEMGRTQDGNNNAYCQDNTTSWLDWSKLYQERELVEFVGRLARLRARHPLLRRRHFVHGDDQVPVTGYKDIEWLRPTGGPMTERDWLDSAMRCLGVLLAGPAPAFPGREEVLLVVFNAGRDGVRFSLPRGDGFDLAFRGWQCVLSTGATAPVGDGQAAVEARSVNVFEPVPHGGAR
jgi:glycogen operon protein